MSSGCTSCGRRCSRSGRQWVCHGAYDLGSHVKEREAPFNHWRQSMTEIAPLDVAAAEAHLMRFLSVEGVTGQEADIAAAVSDELQAVGVPAAAIRYDDANTRIPLPTETGNLIVDLPG